MATYRWPGVAWGDVEATLVHQFPVGDPTAALPPLPPGAHTLPNLLDGPAGGAPRWLNGTLPQDLRQTASVVLAGPLLRAAERCHDDLPAARGIILLARLATPRGDLTVDAAWARSLGVALRQALQGQRLVPFLDPLLFTGLAVAGLHALSFASALAPAEADRVGLAEAWVELLLAVEERDPAGDSLGDLVRGLAPEGIREARRGAA